MIYIKKIIPNQGYCWSKTSLFYHELNTKKIIFSSLINSILFIKNKQLNHDAINSYSNFNRNDYKKLFKNVFKVYQGTY